MSENMNGQQQDPQAAVGAMVNDAVFRQLGELTVGKISAEAVAAVLQKQVNDLTAQLAEVNTASTAEKPAS